MTIKSLAPWKALGQDEMSASFFWVCWNLIKNDLIKLIFDLFYGKDQLSNFNKKS